MKRAYHYIEQNKPALFDWLIFSISLSLGFIFPSLREFVISPAFSYWMLAAVLLYTTGAWLKHPPLYYRIIRSGKPRKAILLLFILIAGHWLIFMTVVYFSETAVRKILHLPKITLENASNGWSVFITIIMASFITWLVFRNRKTIKEITHFSATNLFRRELVADIFLIAGVSILSFVFWEKGIIALLTRKPAATAGDIWFLFVFLSIAYILFYLPLRYLYLIEDHSSRQTWKRLFFIFGLLLIRSLFEMINL